MNYDLGMNLRPGINFCAPVGKIGCRGVSSESKTARLIPLSKRGKSSEEIFFFFGVDVPAETLPYLPDTGPESAFAAHGSWHYYEIQNGIFIAHLQPKGSSPFRMHHVLQAVTFTGESRPRVFLDRRKNLVEEGILTEADLRRVDEILAAKEVVLV